MRPPTAERGSAAVVAPRAPQDLYRILLLRKNGSELLVAGERRPAALPCVDIPRWERTAVNLNTAVRERYGISTVCLFTPDLSVTTDDSEPPLYQVMETREANARAPEGMYWLPVDAFSDQFFANAQDFRALANTLRQIHEFANEETRGPFGKPGWIDELSSWIQHEVDPNGLHLTGEFGQLNASPTFALLRFETNESAVWFKAVGEPNLREFPISLTLSSLFPGFVPNILATHPAWHGWLMTEFVGSTLDEVADMRAWERAAHTLGDLQIASLGVTDRLLDAPCRDLRIASLRSFVDPFMETMSQLMEQQRTTPPPVLDGGELRTLGRQIQEALSKLAELGIPDTLGHLDFNPGNILCSADRCVFVDWAEAYVGPPFLTFDYLRTHLARTQREDAGLSADLVTAYETLWRAVLPPDVVAEAMKVASVLAVFAYATATEEWRKPASFGEASLGEASFGKSRAAGYLRSLTRRMHGEMRRLQDRRRLCIH